MRVQAVCSGSCVPPGTPKISSSSMLCIAAIIISLYFQHVHVWDVEAGIVQRRLSNGIRVNYCHTDNEPRGAMLRVVAAGGRALEAPAAGPSGVGAVSIGARTLSESGTVGAWRRDQVCTLNPVCCQFQLPTSAQPAQLWPMVLFCLVHSGFLSHVAKNSASQMSGDGVQKLLSSLY